MGWAPIRELTTESNMAPLSTSALRPLSRPSRTLQRTNPEAEPYTQPAPSPSGYLMQHYYETLGNRPVREAAPQKVPSPNDNPLADGLSRPRKRPARGWPTTATPLAASARVAGKAAPAGSLQQRILDVAQRNVGTVDYSLPVSERGWQHLQDIFGSATSYRPTDSEAKQQQQPKGIAWCGIFATYAYQQAGLDVHWEWSSGMTGEVEKRWPWSYSSRAAFEADIRPGDVIVGSGPLWHHSIVVSVTGSRITTISGNTYYGRIVERSRDQLSDVTAIYRPAPRS